MSPFIKSVPISGPTGKTTKGLYLGNPEAEGENNPNQGLKEFYEDYLQIDNAIAQGRFIIVGRKGVGKSAYVKHLVDNSSIENELLCSVASPNNVILQKLIHAIPDTIDNKACIIYEWIILTELVKLLLSNPNLKYANGYDALEKFQVKNSGLVNLDKLMSVTETTSIDLDIHFFELIKAFPVEFGKHIKSSQSKAPFFRIIPSLRAVVTKMLGYPVNQGVNYIVLFDDLDIHFDLKNDDHKRDLMELIRVSRDYNAKHFPNRDIRIILMLRDDIATCLDGIAPDKNKIFSSYEYRLIWYNSMNNVDDEESLLRQFINKRIDIGLSAIRSKYNRKDPWCSLVNNAPCEEYNWKTAFKYILDCTLYRPRDLVAFFDKIGEYEYRIPLSPNEIKKLIRRYVNWNAKEVKDELSNMYSSRQIEDLFSVLRSVANSSIEMDYQAVLSLLISKNFTKDDFDKLLDYNYLVPSDDMDRQYYSYRESVPVMEADDYKYKLPKCLYYYFRPNLI